jgi:hypothetical protein
LAPCFKHGCKCNSSAPVAECCCGCNTAAFNKTISEDDAAHPDQLYEIFGSWNNSIIDKPYGLSLMVSGLVIVPGLKPSSTGLVIDREARTIVWAIRGTLSFNGPATWITCPLVIVYGDPR